MTQEMLNKFRGQLPTMIFAGNAMMEAGLPDPELKSYDFTRKIRFFFTEFGWQKCGHKILSEIRSQGLTAKIISLKEKDPRINLYYRDKWQVAVTLKKI